MEQKQWEEMEDISYLCPSSFLTSSHQSGNELLHFQVSAGNLVRTVLLLRIAMMAKTIKI